MHKSQDSTKTQWYVKSEDAHHDCSIITNNSLGDDETDFQFFINRSKNIVVTLRSKIKKTEDALNEAKKNNEDDVLTYLTDAKTLNDRQLLVKRKSDFEKKCLKSNHLINHLQMKLENYHARLREALMAASNQSKGSPYKQAKLPLKDIIRSPQMMPPLTITKKHLGTNRLVSYASADNILGLSDRTKTTNEFEQRSVMSSPRNHEINLKSKTLPVNYRCLSEIDISPMKEKKYILYDPKLDKVEVNLTGRNLEETGKISVKLRERQELHAHLVVTFEALKKEVRDSHLKMLKDAEGLTYQCNAIARRIEDFGQQHKNDVSNFKSSISNLEQKMTTEMNKKSLYIQKMVEGCLERLGKLDQQQVQTSLLVEVTDQTANHKKIFLAKFVNLILSILALVFLVIETFVSLASPITSDIRIFVATMFTVVTAIYITYYYKAEAL